MANERMRGELLLKTGLEVLRDSGTKLPRSQVMEEVRRRLDLTPHELSTDQRGRPGYVNRLGWAIGGAATIGWASKLGGWSITDAGIEALDDFPDASQLNAELDRRYHEVVKRRDRAIESLSGVHQFIARTLELVEPGSWTAHDDIADLAGTTPNEVADFLASGQVKLPTSYRVLRADGSIPEQGQLHINYRGADLHRRLAGEGIEFDASGRASQKQRLTAEDLKNLLEDRAEASDDDTTATPSKRAWLVRGTSADGSSQWLSDGYVSLSAAQLGPASQDTSYDDLKQQVETAYQHKSYAYRAQQLEELDRFIRQARDGDLVLTPIKSALYLGEVTSGPYAKKPEGYLRRDVRWLNQEEPVDSSDVPAKVQALLQTQSHVADLTDAYAQLAALIPEMNGPENPPSVRDKDKEPPKLTFTPVTTDLANSLLMDQNELEKIADLLWDRKQLIFYGPPGTGKTYLATRLARHLTGDGAVKLVQFHPSYTYEDFFEGYRPAPGASGTLTFTLRPGPFRAFAEAAREDATTPYILIVDEINRANLAKVFGELYFLLEYRDQAMSLQYSPTEDFILPENLFIIGTMNTADRSIARIDTAMRRRFAFIELDPRIPPVQGLLTRWLTSRNLPNDGALLLDQLNSRLADADAAIGPSYLMKDSVYRREDGLERVWQYEIMPLLEDLFYGQRDLAELYGLDSLRKAIARQ
jgi:5-methylcytosine-specific restriction protein B